MSDIATIALRVNTSELERGNKALDDFQRTAADAADKADDLNSVFRTGVDSQKKNSDSLKQQQQELQNLLNKISPVNKAMDELEKLQVSLSGFRGKGLLGDDDYGHFNAVLETTRTKLFQVMEAETAEGQERLKLAQETQRATVAQESFLKSITDQAATFRASKADIAEYRAAQMGIAEQAAPVIAQLREQERVVQEEANQRKIAAMQSRMLKQAIAELDAAQRAEAAEVQRAQAVREAFTRTLQEQAEAIGKTRTELLELKAAQLGVSQQAAPFIAKLREQESAWKRGEISAGQYQQAMRQLPGQITDVVTSLSSGMPVWMVAIQQGGQIKDSFGGVGNTFKALTSMITPFRLALGGVGGAAAIVAYQFYTAEEQSEALRKSLALTNGYSGLTATSLLRTVDAARSAGVSYSSATDALNSLVNAGVPAGANFERLTVAAAKFSKESGVALDDLANDFASIANDPSKGILALNEKYHFLTAAQYEHISALQEEGKYTEALAAANNAAADGMEAAASNMKESLGTVSTIIRGLTDMAKGMWDAIEGIGRTPTQGDTLKTLLSRRESIQAQVNNSESTGYNQANGKLNEWRQELGVLNAQIGAFELLGDVQKAKDEAAKERRLQQNQNLKDAQALQLGLNQGLTSQEKREKAINDLNQQRIRMNQAYAADPKNNVGMSDAEYQKRLANINNQFKDPKTPKAKGVTVAAGDRAEDSSQAELLALQAQLKTLQDHRSVNDVISQQRKDLYTTESKFAVLEEAARTRQLSKQEQSLLASKDQVLQLARQKALLGDQITAQEQLNKRMDTAQKYVTQMAEKQAALETGSTMSDRLASRQTALSQLRSGWINSGGSLEDDGYKRELKAANDYYAAEDSLRSDWLKGVQKGWAEFEDSATNVYAQVQDITRSAFTGMATTLTDFFMTGKASFSDFLSSFVKGIVQMTTQLALLNSMKAAFSGTTFGSLLGFSGGGYVSGFDGGGFTGDGGKYEPAGVVHRGEFVFTKEATSAIGVDNLYAMMRGAHGYASGGFVGRAPMVGLSNSSGASNIAPVINTTVNVDASGNASAQTGSSGDAMGRALASEVQNAATQVVQKHLKNGGLIYNFVKGR